MLPIWLTMLFTLGSSGTASFTNAYKGAHWLEKKIRTHIAHPIKQEFTGTKPPKPVKKEQYNVRSGGC